MRGFIHIYFLACFGILLIPELAHATHNRAGEIQYEVISYLRYRVTIITYTKASSVQADRDTLNLNWGDSTPIEKVLRVNGPIGTNGVPQGEILGNDVKKNIYRSGIHAYAGPLPFYIISVADPNRISNIININGGASVNVQFYLEDTLRILNPTFVGLNSSPILLYPPIDYANVNDTFYHNPAAFDPDGDSLVFTLTTPFQAAGFPVPNYQYPDQVSPGINNQFTINSRTGEIIWATPQRVGIYNIAILITEYRNGIKLGTMLRDMQIIVNDEPNNPPRITEFADTCVVAGTLLVRNVNAFDPNPGQSVTLSAEGGPLRIDISPATFSAQPPGNPVSGQFRWQTTCNHIRKEFYQVVFKAQDNYPFVPLVDLKTWIVRVVAPAPENLQSQAMGNSITLTWNQPYHCDSVSDFIGFSVWRREGSNPFTMDTCEVGLAGKGYTKIAENVTAFTYTDNNLNRGRLYCYRILAEFAKRTQSGLFYNKVESLPSNETCAELKRDLPIIKNVSVETTDVTNGEMFVSWYRPIASPDNLDTLQLSGPYSYKLYRSVGFTGANLIEVATFTNPFFGNLLDTVFTDTQLNTVDNAYSYLVKFFANNLEVGESDLASSVYLTIGANDKRLELSWEENVPWENYEYVVFKRNELGVFDSIATVTTQEYTDDDLINDSLYCYYIKSVGEYSSSDLNETLFNLSQQRCERPIDTIPPCPPILRVENSCNEVTDGDVCASGPEAFQNRLIWENRRTGECFPDEIEKYYIYYSKPGENDFALLDSVLNASDTTYAHLNEKSLAGCYAVTAFDSTGNESAFSNIICVDNCPCYKLPNVFTPNNDGRNDFFTPILPYRYVDRVDMKIYNRWGTLVYETTDPEIRWDGRDINNGKDLPEGVYYYVCEVYEIRVDGVRKNSNILNGYIHLIKGFKP